MHIHKISKIVEKCKFKDYEIFVAVSSTEFMYLQAYYWDPDTVTGEDTQQYTRRWLISPEMTKSEIVATAFKCVLTSMEHQAREWFTYKNRAIYQPHYEVEALVKVCKKRDVR